MSDHLTVDIHAHFLPPTLVERVRRGDGPPNVTVESGERWSHGGVVYALDQRLVDPRRRVAHLDELGIDVAVLSIAPDLFLYSLTSAETEEICRLANDDLSSIIGDFAGRLCGLASLPMNNPAAAVAELRRLSQRSGIVGAAIGTSVNDLMLDDSSFDPVYEAAAELDVPILLHPHLEGTHSVCPGLDERFLDNVVGNPLETCRAAARLITGGVFDRHPALRVQLVHGGGYIAYQLGRMERAFEVEESARGLAKKAPSSYMSQLLFDTVVFRPSALEFLIGAVGESQVTFGTDLPFNMADVSPLRATRSRGRGWSAEVMGLNAVRAYRLDRAL